MRAYKFRVYPSRKQGVELCCHLWVSKELWNKLLEATIEKYDSERKFPSQTELQLLVKESGLYSQVAQGVAHRLYRAVQSKVKAKREGRQWGFPRFKSFDRLKSLYYPQSGFSVGKKLNVSPFGSISIKKHREIKGKIKTLTLKREPTGKWFAVFCAEEETELFKVNNGGRIGIDLGLVTFATLSDGEKIANPHHLRKHEEQLAFCQRKLSKKKKGSHNRWKAKRKVALVHEKIANARLDFLHKTANQLLSNYSFIALEDLASQVMAARGHGKGINDVAWGLFANIIRYKAGNAGCEVVFVNPRNTSKECSGCGAIVEKSLWNRQHDCQSCGLSLDRDINAAINILNRATVGMTGSNACRNESADSSVKQETQKAFSLG